MKETTPSTSTIVIAGVGAFLMTIVGITVAFLMVMAATSTHGGKSANPIIAFTIIALVAILLLLASRRRSTGSVVDGAIAVGVVLGIIVVGGCLATLKVGGQSAQQVAFSNSPPG